VVVRLGERIAALRVAEPDKARAGNVRGSRIGDAVGDPPYDSKVERALAVLARGELKKVVVARRVEVRAAENFDVATVLARILRLHVGCYCFMVGIGPLFFTGASPELLVAKRGNIGKSIALAGTAARSADEADNARLAKELERDPKRNLEHRYVDEWIQQTLETRCGAVVTPSEKSVMRLEDVQHLQRSLHFSLGMPTSALILVGALHPTPAVSGYPRDEAVRVLRSLDGFARGWYAGPVGWVDGDGDGEFCVAIRSALVRGSIATLFAGCGIVQDSTPDLEMQESENKLRAMLRVLM
jgi:isochorismate synthase